MQVGIAINESWEPMLTKQERQHLNGNTSRTNPKLIEMVLSGQLDNKGVVVKYMSQAHMHYGCWQVIEYDDREFLELDDEKLELFLMMERIAKHLVEKEYDAAYKLACSTVK